MNRKYKDFEDFIQTIHAEQYQGLDDDMPDDYDNWLQDIEIDTWINYANQWGCIKSTQIINDLKEKICVEL